MERISYLADLSVRRGCAFAVLGIGTMMIGFSGDPGMALKAGAVLTTLMDVVLLIMARRALSRDHRQTELWCRMGKRHELAVTDERAGEIIRRILHDTLLRYGRITFWAAFGLWLLVLGAWVLRLMQMPHFSQI